MRRHFWRTRALIGILLLGVALGQNALGQKKSSPQGKAPAQSGNPISQQDVQALRADVQRMRALIMQMQNNLGSVTSTTTPLKHQFELEIEMWQVALGDMERRLARAESGEKEQR